MNDTVRHAEQSNLMPDNIESAALEIDTTWIQNFKKLETEYNDFYKEIPSDANVYNIYINTNNKIISVIKDKITLNKYGIVSKDATINMIQKNKKLIPDKRVVLKSILVYNFTMEPENILHMMAEDYNSENYLTEINTLDKIVFKETVHFFSDLNAIYLLYKEPQKSNSNTKKIYLKTEKKTNRRRTRYKRT